MSERALKGYVFYCSNNLEASQWSALGRADQDGAIKTISLPCSGKVDVPYLMKAFETGADAVAIVTFRKKECRHFEGNLRAHKRAEAVEALLEEIGVARGRMAVFECDKDDAAAVLGEIQRFMEKVKALPPTRTRRGEAQELESARA
jgi:F420-non-reducing hydrogenase iron-sulfur subunit